jgi:hypothetical protein
MNKKSLKIPKGNQKIEEDQKTQWYKKANNDPQNIHIKRTPLKTGGELRCSGRVSSSCSTI